jgi:hypothetical protein
VRLPPAWTVFWDIEDAGYVRGGSRGHHYDAACRAFEERQAADLGMRVAEPA